MSEITREEKYLAKLGGAKIEVPEPITRKEKFLAKATGATVEVPEPITREEMYLSKINGGGGGGYPEPTGSVTITANGTHDVKDKATAVVNVPNPSTGSISISENGNYDVTDYANANVNVSGSSSNVKKVYSTEYLSTVDRAYTISVPYIVSAETNDTVKAILADNYSNVSITPMSDTLVGAQAFYWQVIENSNIEAVALGNMKPKGPGGDDAPNKIEFITTNGDFPLDIIIAKPSTSLIVLGVRSPVSITDVTIRNVYVPDDSVNNYKTATNWSLFANNIKPLSEWEYYEEL